MDYAVEGTTILSTSKQTITIAILLLGCYTRTLAVCLIRFPSISRYLSRCISCVLSTFLLLNEDDDDISGGSIGQYFPELG